MRRHAGPKTAAARFGLNCKTVRRWRDRWKAAGVEGLIPRYPTRRARPLVGFGRVPSDFVPVAFDAVHRLVPELA